MTDTKPPLAGESWGAVQKELAAIITKYRHDVKKEAELLKFMDRIVPENRIDPDSSYRCDICGHLCKGREGRELNCGIFVCSMCKIRENENSTEGE